MKNKYIIKVSENDSVRKLEDLPFGRLMELMESIKEVSTTDGGIDLSKKTLVDIKKSLDDNNVKLEEVIPLLTEVQALLEEQNAKKRKAPLKVTAKEKLLIMKYLLWAAIGSSGSWTQKTINNLLCWLCDLEESSLENPSKELIKDFAGYTVKKYVNVLQTIQELFRNLVPKSYDENDQTDKLKYKKIFEIIEKIEQDIKKAKESPEGKKL